MSFATSSATNSPYSPTGSSAESTRPLDTRELRALASAEGTEGGGGLIGDVASATVSFSEKALGFLESAGKDVAGAVEDVAEGAGKAIAWPFQAAKAAVGEVVDDVENAAREGWSLVSNGVHAVVAEAESLAHTTFVDLPSAVAADVGSVAKMAFDGATSVAGGALAVASGTTGAKLIDALL